MSNTLLSLIEGFIIGFLIFKLLIYIGYNYENLIMWIVFLMITIPVVYIVSYINVYIVNK